MRKLIAILVVLAAAGSLVQGCGGGGGSAEAKIDKATFVNRSNKICEQTTGKLAAEVGPRSAELEAKPGFDYTKAQTVVVKEVMIPRLDEELEAIRALGVPGEVKKEAKAFVAALQRVADWVKANPKALIEGQSPPYAAAEVAGAKFGVTECPYAVLSSG